MRNRPWFCAATLGGGVVGNGSIAVVCERCSTSAEAVGDRRRDDCESGGAGDRGGADGLHPRPVVDPATGGQHGTGCRGAHFPLAQPRNVIGGHVMSATVGVLVGMIGIDSLWAGALAGALALER